MSIEIRVPQLPESVADALVQAWHKKVGEFVTQDENLVDLETDKVVLEVPTPASGILKEVVASQGSTVKAHDILAVLEPGVASAKVVSTTAAAESKPAKTNMAPAAVAAPSVAVAAPVVTSAARPSGGVAASTLLSPAQRRRLAEMGVAETMVSNPVIAALPAGVRPGQRVPMSRLRARVAERLVSAQQTAAMLTTFNEINLQKVMDLRAEYKDIFEKQHGVRLGFMSFFTKAVIAALKQYPAVNASIDGNDMVYHGYYDIGIAVSTERGLVVPVVRDADSLSMAEIEGAIQQYSLKARDGKLAMEDMTGGTFTITNGGVFGSLLATPILNPPQVGILGMHKIQQRPVVENGAIIIRPMMYVALTYDHRIIDGKESVSFLVAVKENLEDPARLVLDV